MIENNNFPWYLQQSDAFLALYYGFFGVAELASPLGIGDAFDPDKMTGQMLFRLGSYYGMQGNPSFNDGLIYGVDNWSEFKTWTGGISSVAETFYRNFLKAKAYAYGRPYSLETLKGVLDRVFDGITYSATITEEYMSFTINITASQEDLRSFIDMRAFDLFFIGKPVGINVEWNYIEEGSVPGVEVVEVVATEASSKTVNYQNSLKTLTDEYPYSWDNCPRLDHDHISYDGTNYIMYVNKNQTVSPGAIIPLYADKELTNVAFYVKARNRSEDLSFGLADSNLNTYTKAAGRAHAFYGWCPMLGETRDDARLVDCRLHRHTFEVEPYTRQTYDTIKVTRTDKGYKTETYYCASDFIGERNTWIPLYKDTELQHISIYLKKEDEIFATAMPTLQHNAKGEMWCNSPVFYDIDAGETEEQASTHGGLIWQRKANVEYTEQE